VQFQGRGHDVVGAWTLLAGGADIWETTDQFHFVWQTLAGDGSMSARATAQAFTHPVAKAGVMLRLNGDADSPFYSALITPTRGVMVEYREIAGGRVFSPDFLPAEAPLHLRVTRAGTRFSAFTSTDGTAWTEIAGTAHDLEHLQGPLQAGLAVTSHDAATLGIVHFEAVELSAPAP
jgi:hypothetical protein